MYCHYIFIDPCHSAISSLVIISFEWRMKKISNLIPIFGQFSFEPGWVNTWSCIVVECCFHRKLNLLKEKKIMFISLMCSHVCCLCGCLVVFVFFWIKFFIQSECKIQLFLFAKFQLKKGRRRTQSDPSDIHQIVPNISSIYPPIFIFSVIF